jgi:hypothetical protein
VKELVVLLLATGIAGAVVWRLTLGPSGLPRGRRQRNRVRFEDAFEVTALPVTDAGIPLAASSIAFQPTPVEPPRRGWSVVRLVVLVAGLAGIGAGAVWVVAHFVNQALASRLTEP